MADDQTAAVPAASATPAPSPEPAAASAAPSPAAPPAEAQEPAAVPAAPAAVPAPVSALQRLEAFEEKLFGPTVVRIGGKIEQGLGSLFSRLPFVHRAHYAELTALAQVEADYEKARTAFDEAAAKLKAAQAAAASTEAASNAEGQ